MVGGFVCKKGKQEGSFWKKGCKGRDFLVIRGKVGGFGQKALLLSLPMLENRGGAARRRRRPSGGPRARRRPRGGGKGREDLGEPIPHHDLGRGTAWRSVHGGVRRWAEVAAAAVLHGRGGGARGWVGS